MNPNDFTRFNWLGLTNQSFDPNLGYGIAGNPGYGAGGTNFMTPLNSGNTSSLGLNELSTDLSGPEYSSSGNWFLDWFRGSDSPSDVSTGTNQAQVGFGFNMPTLELGIKGLSALGNLWSGYQASKMAQRQYDLAKEAYQTNLANSIKSYNTALTDRIRARAAMETGDKNAYDSYLEENKL